MRRRTLLAGGLACVGCAPTLRRLGAPAPGFTGPRLAPDALLSFDGMRLPSTTWPARDAAGAAIEPWAVVLGLHGFDDYAAAFTLAGPYWAARGVTTYAFDQRGFGRGPGRGLWAGEAAMTGDLRVAVALLRARHPRALLAVVGESMGGAVAICAAAAPDPPAVDRWVLASPAVWGWGAQPPLDATALWIAAHVAPTALLSAPGWLARRIHASDNVPELMRMGRDGNMIFRTRVDTTYGLVELMQSAREKIGRARDPADTLYLYGAHDDIIPKGAAFFAAAALARAGGRTAYYDTGRHLLTRDLARARVLDDVLGFLRAPGAPLPSRAPSIPTSEASERRRGQEAALAAGGSGG